MPTKNGKIVSGPGQYAGSTGVPVGTVISYAGTATTMTGWLLCDGSSVLNTDFPALFAAIGTGHGTADGTHFNIPDYRGRFLRGVDGAAGNDPDSASRTAMNTGGATGNNVGSIQADVFGSHYHNYFTNNGPPLNFSVGSHPPRTQDNGGINTTTDSQGGNETRPKNAYVRYFIKI